MNRGRDSNTVLLVKIIAFADVNQDDCTKEIFRLNRGKPFYFGGFKTGNLTLAT